MGYTNANWVRPSTDIRSISRYGVFVGGNLVSWKSKKQSGVVRPSVEVEYRAIALTTCELLW